MTLIDTYNTFRNADIYTGSFMKPRCYDTRFQAQCNFFFPWAKARKGPRRHLLSAIKTYESILMVIYIKTPHQFKIFNKYKYLMHVIKY